MILRYCPRAILLGLIIAACTLIPAQAEEVQPSANEAMGATATWSAAWLADVDTGTVLFAKNPDSIREPGSITKLMTLEVMFHALREKKIVLTKTFPVSENAWLTGGAPSGRTTMFAALNSQVSLEDLIKGIAVDGANDAAIIIAEGYAGSESEFAKLMNERAKAIGLVNSHFTNATGQLQEGQKMSIRDMARLGRHLIITYPEYYRYFSLPSFLWNGIEQRNHNPLLKTKGGVDGLLTGYSEKSGFMFVASALRNGQRLLAVSAGFTSEKARNEETLALIDWGYSNFVRREVFAEGAIIGKAKVYGGSLSHIDLVAHGSTAMYLPREMNDKMALRVVYQGPLIPPIKKGDAVGELQLMNGDEVSQSVPLYAYQGVEAGSLHQRAYAAVAELLTKAWQKIMPYDIDIRDMSITRRDAG